MKPFVACALMTALVLPGAANAATTITYEGTAAVVIVGDPAKPYSEMVHTNSAATGTSLALTTKPGANNVTVSSTNTLSASGQGGGYATISGVNGIGFSNLTINPTSPYDYFSAMSFTLALFNSTGGAEKYNFSVKVTTLSGIESIIENVAFETQKDKFDVVGSILLDAKQLIDSITIYDLQGPLVVNKKAVAGAYTNYNFASIKQISFAPRAYTPPPPPAVPEPGTWLMMIFGMGGIATMLRRKRTSSRDGARSPLST